MPRAATYYYLAIHRTDDHIIRSLWSRRYQKSTLRVLAFMLEERRYRNDRGHGTAYSMDCLADALHLSKVSVSNSLSELKADGMLNSYSSNYVPASVLKQV